MHQELLTRIDAGLARLREINALGDFLLSELRIVEAQASAALEEIAAAQAALDELNRPKNALAELFADVKGVLTTRKIARLMPPMLYKGEKTTPRINPQRRAKRRGQCST